VLQKAEKVSPKRNPTRHGLARAAALGFGEGKKKKNKRAGTPPEQLPQRRAPCALGRPWNIKGRARFGAPGAKGANGYWKVVSNLRAWGRLGRATNGDRRNLKSSATPRSAEEGGRYFVLSSAGLVMIRLSNNNYLFGMCNVKERRY